MAHSTSVRVASGPSQQPGPEALILAQRGHLLNPGSAHPSDAHSNGRSQEPSRSWMVAGALLAIAIVLIAWSVLLPWWYANPCSPYNSRICVASADSVDYYPGASWSAPGSGAYTYSSTNLSHVGVVYGVIQGVVAASLALGGIAMCLAFVRGYGRRLGRAATLCGIALAILASASIVGVATWEAAAQPSALQADHYIGSSASGASPAGSFWGENATAAWGAGIGWYLSLIGSVLGLGSAAVLVRAHREDDPSAQRPRPP